MNHYTITGERKGSPPCFYPGRWSEFTVKDWITTRSSRARRGRGSERERQREIEGKRRPVSERVVPARTLQCTIQQSERRGGPEGCKRVWVADELSPLLPTSRRLSSKQLVLYQW
ncbi:hypothetical protein J6590_006730, partial [Homalodisca vitripennis]